jgi:hypothetical protein
VQDQRLGSGSVRSGAAGYSVAGGFFRSEIDVAGYRAPRNAGGIDEKYHRLLAAEVFPTAEAVIR